MSTEEEQQFVSWKRRNEQEFEDYQTSFRKEMIREAAGGQSSEGVQDSSSVTERKILEGLYENMKDSTNPTMQVDSTHIRENREAYVKFQEEIEKEKAEEEDGYQNVQENIGEEEQEQPSEVKRVKMARRGDKFDEPEDIPSPPPSQNY
ncbi:uncharacterized protein LOC126665500 [Mercurialis annua]|uniref:uncharacterized protein LOC126665500 n=1 Tax=Mercurialis annua TaxID=3986 RepID=UPI002160351A|nr:uncharacterized protein LOC126665500 [Mercurialis annua]